MILAQMIAFTAEILKFDSKGEKSGWSYVEVPAAIAGQLKPDCRKSFRVRGTIDQQEFNGLTLLPMGDGDFILPVNGTMRRQLRKQEGDTLHLLLAEDTGFKIETPEDLEVCLLEEQRWYEAFMSLPKSHRNYFINHINQAKTIETRIRRIAQTVEAMDLRLDFGAMIRRNRSK